MEELFQKKIVIKKKNVFLSEDTLIYLMKNNLIIASLLLLSIKTFSQETLPYNGQYLLDGAYMFNPALLGSTDDIVLNINYQKQFIKLDESPNVQSIGMHANIFDRVGFGIGFFTDHNGPISANGVNVGASYFIPLGDDDDRKDQFSFGTNFNFYNKNFDNTKLIYDNPNDPLLIGNSNSIFIAYNNIGLSGTYKGAKLGLSVLDIPLSNNIPITNGIEPSPTKFFINTGYEWTFTEGISIEPSVMINLNTNSSRVFDYNLEAKVFNDVNYFSAGVSYRNNINRFGSQQLSLSPFLKGKAGGFFFGAMYNIGLSDISQVAGDSFMLSLSYNFKNFINQRGFRY